MKNICRIVLVIVILSAAFQASGAARFKNADKDRQDRDFLRLCAEGSDKEIIKALKAGANPNAKDERGNTAFKYALSRCGAEVIKTMLEAGAGTDYYGSEVIKYSLIHNPNHKTLQYLLVVVLTRLYGSDYSDKNAFDYILGKGYHTYGYSNNGENLLRTAVKYCSHDVVKAIIYTCNHLKLNENEKYDFINEKSLLNQTLLIEAARYNKKDPKVIEVLIEAGAEDTPDDVKMTALMYAVREHNNEAVKILIEAGTYVDYVASDASTTRTALTCAVENCNVEALKILINAGADVNKGKIGVGQYSALQYAKLMFEQTKNMRKSGRLEQVKSMLNQLENKIKQTPTLMEREMLEAEYIKAKAFFDDAAFEQSKNERFAECIRLLTQAGAK